MVVGDLQNFMGLTEYMGEYYLEDLLHELEAIVIEAYGKDKAMRESYKKRKVFSKCLYLLDTYFGVTLYLINDMYAVPEFPTSS